MQNKKSDYPFLSYAEGGPVKERGTKRKGPAR